MLSPGVLIALYVTILYLFMAPLVLYALYVVFDSLGQQRETELKPFGADTGKDSALWNDEGIVL